VRSVDTSASAKEMQLRSADEGSTIFYKVGFGHFPTHARAHTCPVSQLRTPDLDQQLDLAAPMLYMHPCAEGGV
jgi:hypothetical protein